MVMPAVNLHHWTRDEVLALIDQNPLQSPRWEVVDGELFVTPSPGLSHQRAVLLLARELDDYCRATGVGVTAISPSDTAPESDVVVQPDVYVLPVNEARRMRSEHTARTLLLAVEVLSPGSERGDRGRKRALYGRTVPVYWLVDVDERRVEQWRQGESRGSVHTSRIEWQPAGATQPMVLDLKEMFARIHGEVP